jgi:hypothetical protein
VDLGAGAARAAFWVICDGFEPAAVWNHRMMPSTAADHVSSDRAWHHRDYGTDRNRATPSRGRRLRGATKAAAMMDFLLRA